MADNRNRNRYSNDPRMNGYRRSNGNHQYIRRGPQQANLNPVAYRFIIQALVAGCIMMGILVTQKLQTQENSIYNNIKTSFLSSFSYGKMNDVYNSLFGEGVLPLDPNATISTFGNGGPSQEDIQSVMGTVESIRNSVVLRDYLNGIIVEVGVGDPVMSLVSGVVQTKDISKEILNYIEISLADDSVLTVGFLENPKVSLYEHVKVNQQLGLGTQLEGESMAYYYLALQKDGEYVNLDTLLSKLEELENLGLFGQ